MSSWPEMTVDDGVRREEILRLIVQVSVGPVFDVRQKRTSGRAIAKMLSLLLGVRVLARVRRRGAIVQSDNRVGLFGLLDDFRLTALKSMISCKKTGRADRRRSVRPSRTRGLRVIESAVMRGEPQ